MLKWSKSGKIGTKGLYFGLKNKKITKLEEHAYQNIVAMEKLPNLVVTD